MPVLDSSNVDPAIRSIDGAVRRRLIIAGSYADGLREIVACSGGNERESAVRARMHDRVGNIAPGSVAANGDDRRCTVVERASSEKGFVSRSSRSVKRGIGDANGRERPSDSGFDARAPSTTRGRIQNDANALGNSGSRRRVAVNR
jgi:hypothetical protein